MGVLTKFGVSADSKKLLDSVMAPTNQAMDFVRDHPMLTKMAAIAFPPIRGVALATELSDNLRGVLSKNSLDQATRAWPKTDAEGSTLVNQMGQFQTELARNQDQQREMA